MAAACVYIVFIMVAQIWQSRSVRACPLGRAREARGPNRDAGAKAGPGSPLNPHPLCNRI